LTPPLFAKYPTHLTDMNVNKRLNRLAHWAGEKMGSEVKTNSSEEFRALETEMQLRHEGECLRK